ncbi:hypothetical protein [Xanthomonas campestris]|uniref:hypothetical protein n=1 Tax=Xanthomonas campestris TaxID=339 RepID=UPI0015A496BF|nr:hypothetical protein [Xanthomonas campestris]MCF8827415.1 hypothetical protein [Xanthomonas campestris pv. raphani]MEA9841965.1 hypothetical protein [Xanthomonas campestris pv. raphani]MEA9876366.1 hypothetical protein [Xanthomonas campestris pv. raphani]MEA9894196.1 hypothetical protein [Xanthomonas campestris pv. raphani]MEA9934931.1 hypothetical protein [Xanthomonas campestris pv. raphani]
MILYTTEDGRSQIQLRADQQAVWISPTEIAELFDANKQNISLHLKTSLKTSARMRW